MEEEEGLDVDVDVDVELEAEVPVAPSVCRNATHGRTHSSVAARCEGSSHRCSTRKGGGR